MQKRVRSVAHGATELSSADQAVITFRWLVKTRPGSTRRAAFIKWNTRYSKALVQAAVRRSLRTRLKGRDINSLALIESLTRRSTARWASFARRQTRSGSIVDVWTILYPEFEKFLHIALDVAKDHIAHLDPEGEVEHLAFDAVVLETWRRLKNRKATSSPKLPKPPGSVTAAGSVQVVDPSGKKRSYRKRAAKSMIHAEAVPKIAVPAFEIRFEAPSYGRSRRKKKGRGKGKRKKGG